MALTRRARAVNVEGEIRGSVTYSTDRENEVKKIFMYLYRLSNGFGNDFYSRRTASNSDVPRKQNDRDSISKVKESFKLLFAKNVMNTWQ